MSSRFKFKAWNSDKKLLTRPGIIAFTKGELIMQNCVILQYTGFVDKLGQEVYEDDILLIGETKHHVYWDEEDHTWMFKFDNQTTKLTQIFALQTIIGYNAYERGEKE